MSNDTMHYIIYENSILHNELGHPSKRIACAEKSFVKMFITYY